MLEGYYWFTWSEVQEIDIWKEDLEGLKPEFEETVPFKS